MFDNSCEAIYFGGSHVDPVIMHPHDFDYISFAKPMRSSQVLNKLIKLGVATKFYLQNNKKLKLIGTCASNAYDQNESLVDFSQVRKYPYTQITWFSYLDVLMVKVIGNDVCPKTDVITEHRKEFFEAMYSRMKKLINKKHTGSKR
jgi:hypothetical protein